MLYVCPLHFFSLEVHSKKKVMKAEVDRNVILRKVVEKKIEFTQKEKNRVPKKKLSNLLILILFF